eukprot:450805_1
MLTKTEDNILLPQILVNDLNCENNDNRQLIYDILLYQYMKKTDLNNGNFLKILQITASRLYPDIDVNEVTKIARDQNLSGKMFIKNSSKFKNAIKFAALFKTKNNWKKTKKQMQKIYATINKWTSNDKKKKTKLTGIQLAPKQPTNPIKNETKNITETEYIDKGTDNHIIQTFCAITNTNKKIAIAFLKQSEWNTLFAVSRFYSCNGKIPQLELSDSETDEKYEIVNVKDKDTIIYNHGVEFWYWFYPKWNKRYVEAKFKDIKEEMLQFPQFSAQDWQQLYVTCNTSIQTDKIKSLSSNG